MGVFLGNLTIANGGSNSTAISGRILRTVGALELHMPSAFTGTVTLASADDIDNTAFTTMQSGGSDIGLTAAKTLTLTETPMHGFRAESDGAEGAERVIGVFGEEKPHQ